MRFGSDEQKSFFLAGILAGEINFAIGYTEPEAGTDLASLRTRAVLDGEEWVINGNKVFTSGANQADYMWLACRTDPDVTKHKGISIIVVPTSSPGFKCTPIVTVGGNVTTGHVLRRRARAEGQRGRRRERGVAADHDAAEPRARRARRARRSRPPAVRRRRSSGAATTDSGAGGTMLDLPWVQQRPRPQAHARLEAMKLLNWRMASAVAAEHAEAGRLRRR